MRCAAVATGPLRGGADRLCLASAQPRNRASRRRPRCDGSLSAQFETPYGIHFPIGHYALSAARYMHQYGATPEQLAEVAVAARQWAALNPKAWARDPLTIDDVMASPLLAIRCASSTAAW